MRFPFATAGFCLAVFCLAPLAAADEAGFRLRVELVDGSRVVGTTSNTALTIDLGFEKLTIPLERIRRAQRSGEGDAVRIELNNRDVLSGKLIPEPLQMEAIFGKVTLEMAHVDALEVVPTDTLGWLPTEIGLVVYYALDDEAAVNGAADKHHAQASRVNWLAEGRRGGAVEFDGTGRLTVPHHPELCPEELTLAAWIHPHGETSSYQILMAKTNGGSWNQGYGFVRDSGDSKHLRFFINQYSSSGVEAPIPHDDWSHIAGVFDRKKLSFFVNGERAAVTDLDGGADPFGPEPAGGASVSIEHSNSPLLFGGDTSGYAWQGKMDEIVLYKRALSDKEVRRLYEAGSPGHAK
jgi:hypothetical protein